MVFTLLSFVGLVLVWFGSVYWHISLFDCVCVPVCVWFVILVHVCVDILWHIIIKTFEAIKNRVSHTIQIQWIQTKQYSAVCKHTNLNKNDNFMRFNIDDYHLDDDATLPLVLVMVDGFAHFMCTFTTFAQSENDCDCSTYTICTTFIFTINENSLYSVAWHAYIDGMFWRNNNKFSEPKILLQKYRRICMIPLEKFIEYYEIGFEYSHTLILCIVWQ